MSQNINQSKPTPATDQQSQKNPTPRLPVGFNSPISSLTSLKTNSSNSRVIISESPSLSNFPPYYNYQSRERAKIPNSTKPNSVSSQKTLPVRAISGAGSNTVSPATRQILPKKLQDLKKEPIEVETWKPKKKRSDAGLPQKSQDKATKSTEKPVAKSRTPVNQATTLKPQRLEAKGGRTSPFSPIPKSQGEQTPEQKVKNKSFSEYLNTQNSKSPDNKAKKPSKEGKRDIISNLMAGKLRKRSKSVASLKQLIEKNSQLLTDDSLTGDGQRVVRRSDNILSKYRHMTRSKERELCFSRHKSGGNGKRTSHPLFTAANYSCSNIDDRNEESKIVTVESLNELNISQLNPSTTIKIRSSNNKQKLPGNGFTEQLSPYKKNRPAYTDNVWSPHRRKHTYDFGESSIIQPKKVEVVWVGDEWTYEKSFEESRPEDILGELWEKIKQDLPETDNIEANEEQVIGNENEGEARESLEQNIRRNVNLELRKKIEYLRAQSNMERRLKQEEDENNEEEICSGENPGGENQFIKIIDCGTKEKKGNQEYSEEIQESKDKKDQEREDSNGESKSIKMPINENLEAIIQNLREEDQIEKLRKIEEEQKESSDDTARSRRIFEDVQDEENKDVKVRDCDIQVKEKLEEKPKQRRFKEDEVLERNQERGNNSRARTHKSVENVDKEDENKHFEEKHEGIKKHMDSKGQSQDKIVQEQYKEGSEGERKATVENVCIIDKSQTTEAKGTIETLEKDKEDKEDEKIQEQERTNEKFTEVEAKEEKETLENEAKTINEAELVIEEEIKKSVCEEIKISKEDEEIEWAQRDVDNVEETVKNCEERKTKAVMIPIDEEVIHKNLENDTQKGLSELNTKTEDHIELNAFKHQNQEKEKSASQVAGSNEENREISEKPEINITTDNVPSEKDQENDNLSISNGIDRPSKSSLDKEGRLSTWEGVPTPKGFTNFVSENYDSNLSQDSPSKTSVIDWRSLAKKQSLLMTFAYTPTIGIKDNKEDILDGAFGLSQMYEDNMAKVETLKRLENHEGAINLMKDIIRELETQKVKEGEEETEESKSLTDYKIHAYNRLALELYEQGSYEEVLQQSRKVMEMDKTNLQALYKAYQATLKLNRKDKSGEILKRIRKLMQIPMVLQYNRQYLLDNLSLPNQTNSLSGFSQDDLQDSRLSFMSLGS